MLQFFMRGFAVYASPFYWSGHHPPAAEVDVVNMRKPLSSFSRLASQKMAGCSGCSSVCWDKDLSSIVCFANTWERMWASVWLCPGVWGYKYTRKWDPQLETRWKIHEFYSWTRMSLLKTLGQHGHVGNFGGCCGRRPFSDNQLRDRNHWGGQSFGWLTSNEHPSTHHLVDNSYNQRATFLNSKRGLVTVGPAISLVLLVQIGYLYIFVSNRLRSSLCFPDINTRVMCFIIFVTFNTFHAVFFSYGYTKNGSNLETQHFFLMDNL